MSGARRAYDLLRAYVGRELDRIHSVDDAYAELDDFTPASGTPPATAKSEREQARAVLGVAENASFGEVRRAYDRLMKRSDPDRFTSGSAEARTAAEIRERVRRAYAVLAGDLENSVDATEKRFRSLEID
jgi:DnaJ-domain-containing protein 1